MVVPMKEVGYYSYYPKSENYHYFQIFSLFILTIFFLFVIFKASDYKNNSNEFLFNHSSQNNWVGSKPVFSLIIKDPPERYYREHKRLKAKYGHRKYKRFVPRLSLIEEEDENDLALLTSSTMESARYPINGVSTIDNGLILSATTNQSPSQGFFLTVLFVPDTKSKGDLLTVSRARSELENGNDSTPDTIVSIDSPINDTISKFKSTLPSTNKSHKKNIYKSITFKTMASKLHNIRMRKKKTTNNLYTIN